MFRGVYSWLIELKNSQIWFEDSKAVKPSSTCCGRVNVEDDWSPGRAVSLLTCLSQDVFLEATSLVWFSRKLVEASFSLAFTSFFSILYFALLPCLWYSLFFLLLACLTAAELSLPSRLVVLIVFEGQCRSRFRATRLLNLFTMSEGSAPSYTYSQDSCWTQLAKLERASADSGRTTCVLTSLLTGSDEEVLALAKAILWSDGEAVAGLSGWTGGLMMGTM